MQNEEIKLQIPATDIGNIFGQFDKNVKIIEKGLHVKCILRGDDVKIIGEPANVKAANAVLAELVALSKRGNPITEQQVSYALSIRDDLEGHPMVSMDGDTIAHTTTGKPIKPKTIGQKAYVDAIRSKMVVFGIGPAGTGKTYLAMAMAISAFLRGDVQKIILTRPAIEAGEKLGFLPGDLQSKVDPYLRPLYDALYQIMGAESFLRNMEKGLIEVAPLAYMRGRTLDNAFIILDEAQNTTPAQMKMFLTRLGFGSKAVITGDDTQKDLPNDMLSGLDMARRVLGRVEDISFITFSGMDVVRHPVVQKIVNAYEEYEARIRNHSKKDKKETKR